MIGLEILPTRCIVRYNGVALGSCNRVSGHWVFVSKAGAMITGSTPEQAVAAYLRTADFSKLPGTR